MKKVQTFAEVLVDIENQTREEAIKERWILEAKKYSKSKRYNLRYDIYKTLKNTLSYACGNTSDSNYDQDLFDSVIAEVIEILKV
jgi:hypothetical protein